MERERERHGRKPDGTRERADGAGRRLRRRARVREDRARQDALAAAAAPADAPAAWGAGTGCRLLAAGWLVHLVALGPLRPGTDLAELGRTDQLVRVWLVAVAVWIFCRLWGWRVTADHDGVAVPRFATVDRVPWDRLGRPSARRDGSVRVAGRAVGPFLPEPAARLTGRPPTARAVADRLVVMARRPELRPAGRCDARTRAKPYGRWAPLPLLVIVGAHLLLR